jgi:hypothetical protein
VTYRNPKLLALARDQPCMHCNCQDGTVVAAHANWLWYGKGKSLKAPDYYVAWLCMRCHSELDQGKHMSRDEREWMWLRAHLKTMAYMWENELIGVK